MSCLCGVMFERVDVRQRQDMTRYAFVEFGTCENVQAVLAAGPFSLDDQPVRAAAVTYIHFH